MRVRLVRPPRRRGNGRRSLGPRHVRANAAACENARVLSRPLALRSMGYLTLCSVLVGLGLAVCGGAFLDPSLDGTRDPDWMFWALAVVLVALLVRAPFVGLLIRDDRVTRRSWIRSRSWPRTEIEDVGRTGYSGGVDHGSVSGRFLMLALYTRDHSVIEVPELAGGTRSTERHLTRLREALGLPLSSGTSGRHRG